MKTKTTFRLLTSIFISFSFFSCHEPVSDTDLGSVKPPKQIVSIKQAKEMYDNYSSRRVSIIRKYEDSLSAYSSKFAPTRYAEYDLATIKQYIAYIEQEAKSANVRVSTLRFYLSRYPDSDKFSNGDIVNYPRKNSFFIVPTTAFKGENAGFYIKKEDGKYTAVSISKRAGIPNDNQNKTGAKPNGIINEAGFFMSSVAVAQDVGSISLILNEGTICPPPPIGKNDFGNNN